MERKYVWQNEKVYWDDETGKSPKMEFVRPISDTVKKMLTENRIRKTENLRRSETNVITCSLFINFTFSSLLLSSSQVITMLKSHW